MKLPFLIMLTGRVSLFWVILAAPSLVAGQQPFLVPPPAVLSASPASPSPGQKFTVTAATPTLDKYTTYFEWAVEGVAKPEFSGMGKREITLTAGKIGSRTRVKVMVTGARGESAQTAASITVSDITLVWSAETYTPKWYKGRTLPVAGSPIRVSVIPHIILDGVRIPPEQLFYEWSVDSATANALVGVGEHTLKFDAADSPGASQRVAVVVQDIDKQIRKEARVYIDTATPQIALYQMTPLGGIEKRVTALYYGMLQRGINDFVGEPFFFPATSRRELSYQWKIRNKKLEGTPQNPFFLTIDTASFEEKEIPLNLSVDDTSPTTPPVSRTFLMRLK